MARSRQRAHEVLFLILVGYLVVGSSYAWFTPAWQNPDEPAHYNYIRYLAEAGRLPVLRMGDYPHEYLEEIKARGFPADMPIDPLRYEFHQPPLYYVCAAIIYRTAHGSLLALRLFSVALGAALLLVTWAVAEAIFPECWQLTLMATAFVAFLPMHVAMVSAVNNDALAELWLAVSVLGMVRYLRAELRRASWVLQLGLAIGLGMLTKATVFITLPLLAMALAMAPHRRTERARDGALILGLAGLVLLPWLVRNHLLYGGLDLLGLMRHNQVVLGQPRTAEWLMRMGWMGLLGVFVQTTFRSFWGQFGWMGILLDRRLYLLLGLLSAVAALGIVLHVSRRLGLHSEPGLEHDRLDLCLLRPSADQWRLIGLLLMWVGLTFLSYLWWNAQFVQHQGRYLFPALIPLALAFSVGLVEALRRPRAGLMAASCWAAAALCVVCGLSAHGVDKWAVVFLVGAGVMFLLRRVLCRDGSWWLHSLLSLGLFALDFVCLFGFIVPGLRR